MDSIQLFDKILFGSEYKFWSKKYEHFLIVIQKDDNNTELSIIKDTELDVLYFIKITNDLLNNNRRELGINESFNNEIYISSVIYSINNLLNIHDSVLEMIIKIDEIDLYSEIILDKISNNMMTKNIFKLNDMYKQFTKIQENKVDIVVKNIEKQNNKKEESKLEYKFKKRKFSITSNPNEFKNFKKKHNPNKLFLDDE